MKPSRPVASGTPWRGDAVLTHGALLPRLDKEKTFGLHVSRHAQTLLCMYTSYLIYNESSNSVISVGHAMERRRSIDTRCASAPLRSGKTIWTSRIATCTDTIKYVYVLPYLRREFEQLNQRKCRFFLTLQQRAQKKYFLRPYQASIRLKQYTIGRTCP